MAEAVRVPYVVVDRSLRSIDDNQTQYSFRVIDDIELMAKMLVCRDWYFQYPYADSPYCQIQDDVIFSTKPIYIGTYGKHRGKDEYDEFRKAFFDITKWFAVIVRTKEMSGRTLKRLTTKNTVYLYVPKKNVRKPDFSMHFDCARETSFHVKYWDTVHKKAEEY